MNFKRTIGLIFIIIGTIGLLVFSALSYVFFTTNEMDTFFVFLLSSLVWVVLMVIGIVFWVQHAKYQNKWKRLQEEGTSYVAEITAMYPNVLYSVNGRHPLVVECQYTNQAGVSYLVKSKNIWIPYEQIDKALCAKVWVDPYNPEDYVVECYCEEKYNKNANVIDLR